MNSRKASLSPAGLQDRSCPSILCSCSRWCRREDSFAASETQLTLDCGLDGTYVWVGQPFNQIRQAQLAYGCELVCERFPFLSLKRDEDFARIKSIHFAGQGNNLNAIEILVGLIVANDNGWSGSFESRHRPKDRNESTKLHRGSSATSPMVASDHSNASASLSSSKAIC